MGGRRVDHHIGAFQQVDPVRSADVHPDEVDPVGAELFARLLVASDAGDIMARAVQGTRCRATDESGGTRDHNPQSDRLPVVDELDGEVVVGLADQRLDRLQVVSGLRRNSQLIALDLGLDSLRPLVANQFRDLLGVLL